MTDLIPDYITDTFYKRITYLLNLGQKIEDKSIQTEINRIKLVNGDIIPDKIKTLINDSNNKR